MAKKFNINPEDFMVQNPKDEVKEEKTVKKETTKKAEEPKKEAAKEDTIIIEETDNEKSEKAPAKEKDSSKASTKKKADADFISFYQDVKEGEEEADARIAFVLTKKQKDLLTSIAYYEDATITGLLKDAIVCKLKEIEKKDPDVFKMAMLDYNRKNK